MLEKKVGNPSYEAGNGGSIESLTAEYKGENSG